MEILVALIELEESLETHSRKVDAGEIKPQREVTKHGVR
jgi:hypothetical protein